MDRKSQMKLVKQAVGKAELLEIVKEKLNDCEKCMFIFGMKDEDGLSVGYAQVGFEYDYEIMGFLQIAETRVTLEDEQ